MPFGLHANRLLLVPALALALVACGGDPQTGPDASSTAISTDETGEVEGAEAAVPAGVGAEVLLDEALTEYNESASAYQGGNAATRVSATKQRDLSRSPTPAIVVLGNASSAQKAAFAEKARKSAGDPDQRQAPTGFGRWVTPSPRHGSAARAGGASGLSWVVQSGGWRAAALGVDAGDAKGLRLGVHIGSLPSGAVLRFYPRDAALMVEIPARAVLANLRGKRAADAGAPSAGTFWSPALDGSVGVVEVAIPPASSPGDVSLAIEQVVHLVKSREERYQPESGFSGSCQRDAMCTASTSEHQKARDATTLIETLIFDKFGVATSHTCTATLLTDNAWSGVIHLLTADHCVSSQIQAADTYVWSWWRSSGCDASTPALGTYGDWGNVEGFADYLYSETKSKGTDVALLRLDMYGSLPLLGEQEPALAGWDAATVSGLIDVSAYHHPSGDWLKHSLGKASYKSSNFLSVTWSEGATEGGSSGGALLNASGKVIGTLWGGASSCVDDLDTAGYEPYLPDFYGRFSVAYSRGLRNWLHMPAQELMAAVDLNGNGVRSLLFRPRAPSKAGTQSYAAAGLGVVGSGMDRQLDIVGWSPVGQSSELLWGQAKFIAVADMNGDGREDLLYRVAGSDGLDRINMAHIPEGQESIEVETLHSRIDKGITVVGVGDLDGDGVPDLVLRDPKKYTMTYLLMKSGPLGFRAEPLLRLNSLGEWENSWAMSKYVKPLAVGNFQGDARAEVLLVDARYPTTAFFHAYDSTVSPNSMGSLFLRGRLRSLPGSFMGAAHLNSDNRLDLVFNSSGKISYSYSESSALGGSYDSDFQMGSPVVSLSAAQTSGQGFSMLADLDSDGIADMLWRHKTTGEPSYTLSSRSVTMPLVLTKTTLQRSAP